MDNSTALSILEEDRLTDDEEKGSNPPQPTLHEE
jgi:hypothetical protein